MRGELTKQEPRRTSRVREILDIFSVDAGHTGTHVTMPPTWLTREIWILHYMQVAPQTKWKKKSSEYSAFGDSHWENADLSGFL